MEVEHYYPQLTTHHVSKTPPDKQSDLVERSLTIISITTTQSATAGIRPFLPQETGPHPILMTQDDIARL